MGDLEYDQHDLEALDLLTRACEGVAGRGAALLGLRALQRRPSYAAFLHASREFDSLGGRLRRSIAERSYALAVAWRDQPRRGGLAGLAEGFFDSVAPVVRGAQSRLAQVSADRMRRALPALLAVALIGVLAKDAVATRPPSPIVVARLEDPALAPATGAEAEQTGIASWYGRWHHGKPTATGVAFDMNALTAAHRSLPLDSRIRVTNLENGKSLEVKVNDRGPYIDGRVLDLSAKAAERLDMKHQGLARVKIERVD
jgi:hypothetical protein